MLATWRAQASAAKPVRSRVPGGAEPGLHSAVGFALEQKRAGGRAGRRRLAPGADLPADQRPPGPGCMRSLSSLSRPRQHAVDIQAGLVIERQSHHR